MLIKIKINTTEFPLLKNIKEDELDDIIYKILRTGYDIHFPNVSLSDELASNIVYNKINDLEHNLNKLISISNNSSKKGNFAENYLEEIFKNRYGDIIFERKSSTPHSGDAWLYLPDNSIILLESKNYNTTVNKEEIIKMENDMKTNHIKYGILTSLNSQIQGMKELDYYTFCHNKESYSILMISNLSNDISRLDLSLQILRRLMSVSVVGINYEILVSDINKGFMELNKIVERNYILRDNYYNLEREIHRSLSNYHIILRDYQYDMDMKIKEIINKLEIKEDDMNKLLLEYKNKKIFSILSRLIDIIKSKGWIILNDNIVFKDKIIGIVKIQIKKIVITINDIDINLNIGKEKELKKNLDILKNF